ncbi:MAG: response regulator [Gammaproteobacteria bacterium]|nr:response regulator [Gammaproteobacteria bacterium]
MQHKQTIKDFVTALTEYVQNSMDGTVVIMGDNDGWGKLIIENAQIVSINYGIYRGMQVLPELEKLNEIRFMFRPAKQDGSGGDEYVKAGSARISNEEFFSYFGVKVPRAGQATAQPAQASASDPATQAYQKNSRGAFRETILIIDDSAIARKAAADPLAEFGYNIIEAKDGFDALGKLDKEVPDAIILDLIMPGIDGYKVVDLLKSNKKFSHLPIIMVTSKDSLMDKVKGKMSATDAYITKPFKEGDLLRTLTNVLKK